MVPLYVVYMPASASSIAWIGGGFVLGVPTPILFFALVVLLSFAFLRFTKQGRFIYAIGDNFAAARISGAPVRPIIVLQNPLSATVAYLAGMITATVVASMNTAIATSSMIYDHPGRRSRRHRTFWRARRRPQRDRRHVADRHPVERDEHHEYPIHAAERDQEFDPARRHCSRQPDQSTRRTDRATRRHLERDKKGV
jgi:hypothetical protein